MVKPSCGDQPPSDDDEVHPELLGTKRGMGSIFCWFLGSWSVVGVCMIAHNIVHVTHWKPVSPKKLEV